MNSFCSSIALTKKMAAPLPKEIPTPALKGYRVGVVAVERTARPKRNDSTKTCAKTRKKMAPTQPQKNSCTARKKKKKQKKHTDTSPSLLLK
jgi:hypothetical protein